MNTSFPKSTKVVLFILFLVFLALAIFGWIRLQKSKSNNPTSKDNQEVQVEQMKELPNGKFVMTSDKKSYQLSELIVLSLNVDSANDQIVSYDLLLPKNSAYEFVSAKSMNNNYEFVTDTRGEVLSFTGYLKLDVTTASVFKGDKLLEVTLRAKAPLQANISPVFEALSTADSNLMTSNNQDILGSVSAVDFEIK